MEGGKGTARSVRRTCAPRQFPAGYVLVAAGAAAAGAAAVLDVPLEDVLGVVLGVLLVEDDALLDSEPLELSFLVEL